MLILTPRRQGRGEEVPANAALVYDMELVTINGRSAAITAQELDSYKVPGRQLLKFNRLRMLVVR